MNRNRFLSAAIAFVLTPGVRDMTSMPPSTNEIAALGAAIYRGVYTPAAGWPAGIVTFGPIIPHGIGSRPSAVALTVFCNTAPIVVQHRVAPDADNIYVSLYSATGAPIAAGTPVSIHWLAVI